MAVNKSKRSAGSQTRNERKASKRNNKTLKEQAKTDRYNAYTEIRQREGGRGMKITFWRRGKKRR